MSAWPQRRPASPRLAALRANLHFIVVGAAAVALFPVAARLHLPLAWPWDFVRGFTTFVTVQSISAAAVLYLISRPAELRLVYAKYRRPLRAALLAGFCAALIWRLGLHALTIYTMVAALAVFEFLERKRARHETPYMAFAAVIPAGIYLVLGFLLVFTYSAVIASARPFVTYDPAFNSVDARLFGATVSPLAHRVAEILPAPSYRLADLIYFGMFGQLGAAAVICGMGSGPKHALQFVGAILLAQSLALILFYAWPTYGPWYGCVNHFAALPFPANSYAEQSNALAFAERLWRHQPLQTLAFHYYLSFPCTHLTQPLIVLWFLRRWKRAALALIAYDAVLVPVILLLEWHYFVDMLGGVAVAAVVIWIMRDTPAASPDTAGGATEFESYLPAAVPSQLRAS